jgi:hypothetical protein
MILQVDIDNLINNRTKIDQFLVLQLIQDNEIEVLNKYLSIYSEEEKKNLFISLVTTGWVDDYNNIGEYNPINLKVKSSLTNLTKNGDYFDEFLNQFPASVTRPDGNKDYLRTDINRVRKLYSKITGNKYLVHKNILDCLRFEILLRNKECNMAYMKRLPKWLASEEWKIYEQRLKDEGMDSLVGGKEGDIGYGNSLE